MIELYGTIQAVQVLDCDIFAVPVESSGTSPGGAIEKPVDSVSYVLNGNTATETTTYKDGTTATAEITFDENGNPVSVVENTTQTTIFIGYENGVPNSLTVGGKTVSLSWEGF